MTSWHFFDEMPVLLAEMVKSKLKTMEEMRVNYERQEAIIAFYAIPKATRNKKKKTALTLIKNNKTNKKGRL
ncbi:MAG: hypothetical protein J5529_13405 [Prevotella sp.]|nr:hypothetical protein [Prevotella sp.]